MCFLSLIRFSNIPINSHERFLDYLSSQVSSSRFSYRLPLTDLILEHLPKWKSYPFLINLIHPHHSIHYSGRKSKTGSRHRVYQNINYILQFLRVYRQSYEEGCQILYPQAFFLCYNRQLSDRGRLFEVGIIITPLLRHNYSCHQEGMD